MNRHVLCVALLLSPFAQAATFCIDTVAEFNSALETATHNGSVGDELRLVTGSYGPIGDIDEISSGDLSISGGWTNPCIARSSISSISTIFSAPSTDSLKIQMHGADLEIERMRFTAWNSIIFGDYAPAPGNIGTVRIARSIFTSTTQGLLITSGYHDVTVENSVFAGNTNSGLRIRRTTSGTQQMDLLVQFNTFANNDRGLFLDLSLQQVSTLNVLNNVASNNSDRDLVISGQLATVRNSFWNSQLFQTGGGLTGTSSDNRSGDAGLDAALRPIEPTSQLINNGKFQLFGVLSSDNDGGPRRVGSNPDIGAYESAFNDSPEITVTSTGNSGIGTLRQAIIEANNNTSFKKIVFNIDGVCPRSINLTTALPALTQPVEIDGYTQPGSIPNDDSGTFGGTVCVFLRGAGAVDTGLHLQTDAASEAMTVRGLGFYGFSGEALLIDGPGHGNISGNLFGTGLLSNEIFADTVIRIDNAPDTRIGGPDRGDRNVIGGGAQFGIRLDPSAIGHRVVQGNSIGVNRSGTGSLANGIGVRVDSSKSDQIISNVISFNDSHGILVLGDTLLTQGVTISNNRIGMRTGNDSLGGNGGNGVRLEGGVAAYIYANQIWNHPSDGIVVLSTSRANRLTSNNFRNNTLQAIDLSPNGVNPIDLDVGQTGANDQQNYPSINTARGSSSQGRLAGVISSANGTYIMQVFISDNCTNAAGFTQAEQTLGFSAPITATCAGINFNCSVPFEVIFDNSVINGESMFGKAITTMARDEEGNSSEISECHIYTDDGSLLRDGFE